MGQLTREKSGANCRELESSRALGLALSAAGDSLGYVPLQSGRSGETDLNVGANDICPVWGRLAVLPLE